MAAEPHIRWWRTEIGDTELAGIAKSLRNRCISHGSVCAEFEARIAAAVGVKHALLTTSGTAALYLGLKACEIGPGDEVLIPTCTWVATAHAAMMTGASVRLVECDLRNGLLDPAQLEKVIGPRTRAIVPVHLNGNGVDMEQINAVCRARGIAVVEDACQAILSRGHGRALGTAGEVGCYSLGLTKLITTGQGGVVVTDSDELCERIRMLRNHGVEDQFADSWTGFGFNFKFTDLLAGMGLKQLERAAANLAAVARNHAQYHAFLGADGPVVMVPLLDPGESIPLYCEATCADLGKTRARLAKAGIESRPVPPCLHSAPYLNSRGDVFPNGDSWQRSTLILPCGPGRTEAEVAEVCEVLASL